MLSVIPATFEQDQFSLNLDHQASSLNNLSGKYFFSNQPSRDPLADGAAVTLHEREETTYQRTLSISDVHVIGSTAVNELRGGFFRNRNDSRAVRYFTNAEFGIQNPFASRCPTSRRSRSSRTTLAVSFGSGHWATARASSTARPPGPSATLSLLVKGRHSLRIGGEFRRHALDGDLQETRNRRHNFENWFDFLTVGFANPGGQKPRAADFGHRPQRGLDGPQLPHDRLWLVRRGRLEGVVRLSH